MTPLLFMGLFDRRRHRREDMSMLRRVVDDAGEKPWYRLSSPVWRGTAVLVLSVFLALVCFWGRPPHLPVLLLDSESKVRHEARFSFSYTSRVMEERLRENARLRTEPVHRLASQKSAEITTAYKRLIGAASKSFDALKFLPPEERLKQCGKIIEAERLPGIPGQTAAALAHLVEHAPDRQKFSFRLNAALDALEELLRNGIFENTGDARLRWAQSVEIEDARRSLRDAASRLAANEDGTGAQAAVLRDALTTIFSPGLLPNVEIDEEATRQRQQEAANQIKPPLVEVRADDTLLTPGETVTPEILERWNAYRLQAAEREKAAYGPLRAIEENFLPALGIMLIAVIFAQVRPPRDVKRRHLTLALLMVPANLALIRVVLELGESQPVMRVFHNPDVFFWMAPPALAAILVVVMAGPYLAVFAAFLVSAFSALMLGRSVDVLLVFALASLVGILQARNARDRRAVLRAGTFAGAAAALPVFFICQTSGLDWGAVALQTLACLLGGLLTGMFAVSVIPLLERVFKITTNITLLELTDYNHELLRKLQLIAPGTFNHSVSVANLAEAAASRTTANALLCRCAALFHDIGKTMKPEYFVENQREENPHFDINPTVSALVIKSHVRDGVRIAKEYALPRAIIDIIEQHHGTGLIQYFYHKAKKQTSSAAPAAGNGQAVDETSFRYDGPRPRSKEAAIVLFADSLEAASRSLKKVTPTAVKELVEYIVSDRIKDGQLDECPLTFGEVKNIRESLQDSLLNMFHHRVEYPKEENAK
jgi:putative nucleotidyltransferase with HDIG domain